MGRLAMLFSPGRTFREAETAGVGEQPFAIAPPQRQRERECQQPGMCAHCFHIHLRSAQGVCSFQS